MKFGLVIAASYLNAPPCGPQKQLRVRNNSDLFVWIFLAFCALIVVAQLIPAAMVMFGFSKGIKKEKAPAAPKPVDRLTSTEV